METESRDSVLGTSALQKHKGQEGSCQRGGWRLAEANQGGLLGQLESLDFSRGQWGAMEGVRAEESHAQIQPGAGTTKSSPCLQLSFLFTMGIWTCSISDPDRFTPP